MVPEPPCTASPIGLLSTSTSSSSCSVIDLRKARSFWSLGGVVARLRRLDLERRDADRLAASAAGPWAAARLPFTRTSPLRMMRWMWLNDRPGNRASKKRSSRMPSSSPVDGDGLHALSGGWAGADFDSVMGFGSGARAAFAADASSSERIRRNCGKRNNQSATTRNTPTPPSATASGAPISAATAPARKSPR